jgi:hypothetical protein
MDSHRSLYPSLPSVSNEDSTSTDTTDSSMSSRLALSSAFKFGGFETINDQVLKEMNERAKRECWIHLKIRKSQLTPEIMEGDVQRDGTFGVNPMTPTSFRSRKRTGVTTPISGTRSQAAIVASSVRSPTSRRTHKRYSSIHRRNFAKMDSIASHYSVQANKDQQDVSDSTKSGDKRAGDEAVKSTSPLKKRRTEEFGPLFSGISGESNRYQTSCASGSGSGRTSRPTRGARAAPRGLSSIPSIGNLRAHVSGPIPAPAGEIPKSPSVRSLKSKAGPVIHADPEPSCSATSRSEARPTVSLRCSRLGSLGSLEAGMVTCKSAGPTKENGNSHQSLAHRSLRGSASMRSLRPVTRVESMLNRLPATPQCDTPPEMAAKILSALEKPPSTAAVASRLMITQAAPTTSKIPRSTSAARGLNSAVEQTSRLARSRFVGRSSPNLKSLAVSRQDSRPGWR